ncbi:MAG: ornithine cyclodeaminase family protein, partial [Rhodobacteraceae bacterium]|nr:ornithine cyclodeaminase family protein [Paracoccaceae bacterium]
MTATLPFTYLSDSTLAGLGLDSTQIADAIETAIREQEAGRLWAAPKAALFPQDGRYRMATLATGESSGLTVVKSVTVNPAGPAQGLPSIDGALMVMDSCTGHLLGVLDAGWITAVRTAGMSMVMARRLANPRSDSIGFIGTGVQAQSHLQACCALFPIRRIRLYGRGRANIARMTARAQAMGLDAMVCQEANQAISDVDLVVSSITLTYETAPFLDARRLRKGAFAAITDLGIPWHGDSLQAFDAL